MDTLNIKDLLKYYLKNIFIVILIIALVVLLGDLFVEYIQIPKYKGETTIILVQDKNDEEDGFITQSQLAINEKLVSTYSEIIKSRRVLDQVSEELNITMDRKKFLKKITVSSVNDTPIIKITVKDKNNKRAADIANKIAEIFQKEIVGVYDLENVSIIDHAKIESKPYNVDLEIQLPIFGVLGFLIAIVVVFIRFYFNNTIKTKKEIEKNISIPVIVEVPYIKKKKEESKKGKNLNNQVKKEKLGGILKKKKLKDTSEKKKGEKINKKEKLEDTKFKKNTSKENTQKKAVTEKKKKESAKKGKNTKKEKDN